MKITHIICIVFLFHSALYAQKGESQFRTEYISAEYMFFDKQYSQALEKFDDLYRNDTSNYNLAFRLGSCYYKENMFFKAIKYLEFAKGSMSKRYKAGSYKERDASYEVLYLLGKCYQNVREYSKAKVNYQQFDSLLSVKEVLLHDIAKNQIKACDRANQMVENPIEVEINNLGGRINSKGYEMNAVVSANDSLMVFARKTIKEQGYGINKYYVPNYAIFTAHKTNKGWKEGNEITKSINSNGFYIPVSLSFDGKMLILFRDNYEFGSLNDNDQGALFYSENTDGKWSVIKKFDDEINSSKWESSGCINSDGSKFYFSSNRRGGLGGMDLYVCEKIGEKWQKAENLGNSINSELNEENPILLNDSTLYFTSEKHDNMGGYDVFISKKIGGKWSQAVNVGYPVNSASDDMMLSPVLEGSKAYFSTYRPDGFLTFGQGDIYAVTFIEEEKDLKEKEKEEVKEEILMAYDTTLLAADSAELAIAEEQIAEKEEKVAKKEAKLKKKSKEVPVFSVEQKDGVSEIGYTEKSEESVQITETSSFYGGMDSTFEEQSAIVSVAPAENHTTIDGKVESSIYGDIQKPVDVTMVDLSNNETVAQMSADSDNETYQFEVEPGEYKIVVESEGHHPTEHSIYIPKTNTATVKIESKLDPENMEGDDYFLIKPVFFAYGSAELSREAQIELERLYIIMEQNKSLYLEVVGHTDKTSSYQFNKKLSQKRASSVTEYLIKAGIDPVRFVQRGMSYDENIASNDTEEGRQFNRRVDMSIIKSNNDKIIVQEIAVPEYLHESSIKGEYFVLVELDAENNSNELQELVSSENIGGETVTHNNHFYFYAGVFSKKSDAMIVQNKLISAGYYEAEIVDNSRISTLNRSINREGYDGIYTLQMLALKEPCDFKKEFESINNIEVVKCDDGFYRYVMGKFSSKYEATIAQENISSMWEKGSFIVELEKIERIGNFINR